MTAGDVIRAVLDANRRERREPSNLTQLAKQMKVAREAVSRRVNGTLPMTDDYAERFAAALGISAENLRPPAVEVISLESLDRRLQSLEGQVRDSGKEATRAIRALTRAIERLERQLDDEAPTAKTVQ